MRPPVLVLLRFSRGWAIPLPLVLVWPFVALAWVFVTLLRVVTPSDSALARWLSLARQSMALVGHLPGLRVDVRPKDGRSFNVQII